MFEASGETTTTLGCNHRKPPGQPSKIGPADHLASPPAGHLVDRQPVDRQPADRQPADRQPADQPVVQPVDRLVGHRRSMRTA